MKETYILLRNQTEFPKMSNNSKNTGVEFAEHGSTWTQFLNHVFTIFHGMDLLLNARSKRMPAKVRFRSLTLDQQVSSVVSAFKQKLGMVNWSTLAATLGVCYCAVRPLCHLLRLITENGTYEFLFLVMDLGVYKLDITLDYSLCDEFRDPPKNWFIVSKRYVWNIIKKNFFGESCLQCELVLGKILNSG